MKLITIIISLAVVFALAYAIYYLIAADPAVSR